LSFFDDGEDTETRPSSRAPAQGGSVTPQRPRPRTPAAAGSPTDHHTVMVRRRWAAGIGVVLLILIIVLVAGCLSSDKQQKLKDYNRTVNELVRESDSQVTRPLFGALTGASSKSALNVELQIDQLRMQAQKIADRATAESISIDEAATRTLVTIKESGERMPGFGHRVHTKDPRTARLFELAREAGLDGPHMKAVRAIEKAFADAKKTLPINVDGAIGAILADLGMNPAAFNGIFMIARTPGLVAHVIEEQTREKPMRRIDPVNHGYDGPAARSVETTTNEHQ